MMTVQEWKRFFGYVGRALMMLAVILAMVSASNGDYCDAVGIVDEGLWQRVALAVLMAGIGCWLVKEAE